MSLQKPVTVTVHDQTMAYNDLAASFPPRAWANGFSSPT